MRGSTEPRLWTPPLRELTPETSDGFEVIEFAADVLRRPLDPWQQWLAIHGLELLPDGRPRFRQVLVMAARQNGKTELPVVLTLWWQFVCAVPLILGTSTTLGYARESWLKARKLAERTPEFQWLLPKRWYRNTNGEQESWTIEDSRYKIAASNQEGGRSLTIHRLILDELRQHHDYSAWDASVPATNAVYDAQIWGLSNAGGDDSVVLNDLRDNALAYIETGQGDPRLGLFEWSAPEDADPQDITALAQANPNLGHRLDAEALMGEAAKAVAKGGQKLTGFKTEVMCIRVKLLNPAIDPGAWKARLDKAPIDLAGKMVMCLDVAMDMMHATLVAAAKLPDGRVRVEPIKAWQGKGCATAMARELPGIVEKHKPQAVGWFPAGPAAGIAAELVERRGWPPRGVTVEPIRGDMAAACMGLAEAVTAGGIAHSDDPLLNAQVEGAERLKRGDAWVFTRRGEGHVDAVYAAAGAVQLAKTLPAPIKVRPILVVGESRTPTG